MTDHQRYPIRRLPGMPRRREARGMRLPTQWLGVAPFFIFAVMFLILPTLYLMLGAFQNDAGEFTLENIAALSQPSIVAAYWIRSRSASPRR